MKPFGGKHEIWSAEFDGCSLGVTSRTRTKDRGQHWRNQLKVVSNSEVLVEMMRVRCLDNHLHGETR